MTHQVIVQVEPAFVFHLKNLMLEENGRVYGYNVYYLHPDAETDQDLYHDALLEVFINVRKANIPMMKNVLSKHRSSQMVFGAPGNRLYTNRLSPEQVCKYIEDLGLPTRKLEKTYEQAGWTVYEEEE